MGVVDITARLTEQDYADFIALAKTCGVTPFNLASAIVTAHIHDSRAIMARSRPQKRTLKLVVGGQGDA